MKKILLVLFVIIGCTITANAQQTVVLQNQQTSTVQTTDPNIKYINGIPTTEDIGGVDVDLPVLGFADPSLTVPIYDKIVFTNYNPFPVTVLYEYGNLTNEGGTSWSNVGTIVLPPASNDKFPSKEVAFGKRYVSKLDVMTITRKVGN